MPLQKNQVLTLTIERLSNDGSGVAHSPDGEAVFIPGTAPGDVASIRIVKDCGRYAFGILDAIQTPSPDRIPVDCAVAGPCGGCSLRHLDYAAELRARAESVTDAFRRIGGLDVHRAGRPPSPRSTATATKFSSRWAVIRTASPASVSPPGAPTALFPAPIASCSRMC
ncbi:MAG: TRAM domain-containing protein [Faecalibacterium sp.]